MGKTAQVFKEKVEELSGGSVTVELYPSGVFDSGGDVLDTMTSGGTVDISRISTASLKDYDGIKLTNLLSVPYIFSSRDCRCI